MEDENATTPVMTVEGSIVTIRLNRPTKLNRIEPADLRTLADHLAVIEAQSDQRVLVLTGTGRVFSAGYHLGDLSERRAGNGDDDRRDGSPEAGNLFETVVNALEACRIPTICALNGSVYGGATDLALACDFRVGILGTELVMPAAKLGIHYYRGGMERYVTRLGLNAAKKLFLTALPIKAEELVSMGYLTEAVSKDEHSGYVAALAEQLAANAPLSTQNMKRALNQIARNALDEHAFANGYRACMESADLAEGLRAWKEKRSPQFEGR
ncbi:MAG: enoyl-CoA hydratase/isomerase family protein [Pseudomonadota bacterium]